LREFNKSFSKDGKSKGVADDFLNAEDPCGVNGLTTAQVPAGTPAGLSPKAAAMIREIPGLFDSGASAATIVSRVTTIENEANKSLSATEAGAVVSVGAVAISSAQYWNTNLTSWRGISSGGVASNLQLPTTARSSISLVNTGTNAPMAALSMDVSIGKADLVAFVTSVLAGWWLGGFDLEVSAIRAVIASMMAAF